MEANTDNFWEGKEFDEVFEELDRRGKIVEEKLAKVLKEVDEIVARIESGEPTKSEIPPADAPAALFEVKRELKERRFLGLISFDPFDEYGNPVPTPRLDRDVVEVKQGSGTQASWIGLSKSIGSRSEADKRGCWNVLGFVLGEIGNQIGEWKLVEDRAYVDIRKVSRLNGWGRSERYNRDASGNIEYVGMWKNGIPNGPGRLRVLGGLEFRGIRETGSLNGRGVLIWPCGTEFSGTWEKGLPNGLCIIRWSSGQEFRGIWSNGLAPTEGEFFNPDGQPFPPGQLSMNLISVNFESKTWDKEYPFRFWFSVKFKWKNKGELIGRLEPGANGPGHLGLCPMGSGAHQGKVTLSDGTKLECTFQEGEIDGKVVVTDPKGFKRVEYWNNGVKDTSLFASLKFMFRPNKKP